MTLAIWNPGRRTWDTPAAARCGHAAPYRDPWPTGGALRSGRARRVELPTPRGGRGALLPTPRVSDANGPYERKQGGPDLRTVVARGVDTPGWGKYAPALDQWAALTRPAPAPTRPGQHP
ncbi:hypothetical protein [Actinomadura sp. NEAU-AAG7]|uniref:hypothetical protein n=1 Tax=Actinomadura sp. NEAU-AAG7 TaxID=2839640 RepID=UPI001BE47B03|nr:hypothetical protein [Actinomadura sp. NEAU-AAG7]MBT2213476.1 hypothetical protein [Actinomadura sp. NEAU-AAG7]